MKRSKTGELPHHQNWLPSRGILLKQSEIRLNRDKDIVDARWRSDSANKENCVALDKEVVCLPRQGN
jgi:hypothetical protein